MTHWGSVLALIAMLVAAFPARAQVDVKWAMHHDHEEVTRLVHAWAEVYPSLASLKSLGKSVQDRDLWLLALTNQQTGPASEKSALWIDGHSDGGEVLCKEVALYLIDYLLRNHGTDPRVTRILDTRTVYIEPNADPDPGEQVIQASRAEEYQGVSRTGYLYPWDDDGDGRKDEEPPEDVDGDGRVLSMRVADPNGGWKLHPGDGRLLTPREADDGDDDAPFYRLYETEGDRARRSRQSSNHHRGNTTRGSGPGGHFSPLGGNRFLLS